MRSNQGTDNSQPKARPRLSPEISEFIHMLSALEDRLAGGMKPQQ